MTNLTTLSHNKLIKLKWIGNAISLLFLVIVPLIIVGIRYDIFSLETKVAIPGTLYIVVIVILYAIIMWCKKNIKMLKELKPTEITMKQRYEISILNMVKKLIFPIALICIVFGTYDNLYYSAFTLTYIAISMSISFIIDGIFTDVIKSLLLVDTAVLGKNEYLTRENVVNNN